MINYKNASEQGQEYWQDWMRKEEMEYGMNETDEEDKER